MGTGARRRRHDFNTPAPPPGSPFDLRARRHHLCPKWSACPRGPARAPMRAFPAPAVVGRRRRWPGARGERAHRAGARQGEQGEGAFVVVDGGSPAPPGRGRRAVARRPATDEDGSARERDIGIFRRKASTTCATHFRDRPCAEERTT